MRDMRTTTLSDFVWNKLLHATVDMARDREQFGRYGNHAAGMRLEMGATFYLEAADRRLRKTWVQMPQPFWNVLARAWERYLSPELEKGGTHTVPLTELALYYAEQDLVYWNSLYEGG